MIFRKQIQKDVAEHGKMAFKVMSFHTIAILTVVSHVLVFWLSTMGSIFPETDAFQSIVGTCAEIIAGLYGITLAGYTFFLSRIDALSASDMTLDYVVSSIKNRFKYLIWFITFNVLMSLFTSIVLMYAPIPEEDTHVFFYRLFCNEFLLFTGYSIVLILYYSVLVIDPNCVEKEAAKLKKRLSRPTGLPGSAAEFISLYDRIEAVCNSMLPQNVLNQIHDNKGKRFEYTIGLLQEQGLLSQLLIADLNRIHRYYECVINTTPLSVTQEMCVLARHVLAYLEGEDSNVPSKRK